MMIEVTQAVVMNGEDDEESMVYALFYVAVYVASSKDL